MPNSEELAQLIVDNLSSYQDAYNRGFNGEKSINPFIEDENKSLVWFSGYEDGKASKEMIGLTPERCFILGMEFCGILIRIEANQHIEKTIHSHNLIRLKKTCKIQERRLEYKILNDDWVNITIYPKETL